MYFSCARDLEQYGAQLALGLKKGAVLILSGVMGAGKTTFVRGLLRGLGSDALVSSPTYTYIHEYPSPKGLVVHIDAYRLENPDKLWQMGLEDYLENAFAVLIEWGEGLTLDGATRLHFKVVAGGREVLHG
ncbi:MAG: tRNA (adenosine(37)-N6)-threonylcarbamoyltransferase complex ATPase subunit type 1 TsaE [Deinococcales bacterium]